VQPFILGWLLGRVDPWVGYAFVAPTGEFFPLSSSNNGSGYWGDNFATGTTFYLTKNKGTQRNLANNWEFHGTKKGTNIIPGQAFTMEWGLGQMLPVRKNLVQLGLIAYDQCQVTANQGPTAFRSIPGTPSGFRRTSFLLAKAAPYSSSTSRNIWSRLRPRVEPLPSVSNGACGIRG